MNTRRVLQSLVGVFAGIAAVASIYVFVGYLGPSTRADTSRPYTEISQDAVREIPIDEHIAILAQHAVVFFFKPSTGTLDEIRKLEQSVYDPAIESYIEELGVFAYWGISTRSACVLTHAPKGYFEFVPEWPGGFYDVCRDSSYDYAGRTLSDPDISYARFAMEVPNLYVPKITVERNGMIRISGRPPQNGS